MGEVLPYRRLSWRNIYNHLHNCSKQADIDRFFSFDTNFLSGDCRFQYPNTRCPLRDTICQARLRRRRFNRYLCRCVFTFTSSRSAPDAAAPTSVQLSISRSLSLRRSSGPSAHSAAVSAWLSSVANARTHLTKLGQTGFSSVFGTQCTQRKLLLFTFRV